MTEVRPEAIERGVTRGVSWNSFAFAGIGACGVAMNLAIARYYPPAALGVFNTVLAVFIVGGQLGALGVQHSVLYHAPIVRARGAGTGALLRSALGIAAVMSAALATLILVLRDRIALLLDSPDAAQALLFGLPGIWLFPVNKVLLGHLNGVGQVRAYAIGNLSRYVLIVAWVGVCIGMDLSAPWLCASLSVAESVLALGLGIASREALHAPAPDDEPWRARHLQFGTRALPAGVVSELNSRIDVLVLGVMIDVEAVGVYSMASIFAEGLYQMVMVLRFSFDPMLAVLIHSRRWDELRALVGRGRRLGYAGALIVGAVSIAVYPLLLSFVLGKPDFDASWPVYAALAAGVMLAAGYIPVSGILQQAGHPGAQSVLFILVALTNLLANVVFIAGFGVLGAAVATALAQVSMVPYLMWLVRRRIGFAL